MKLETLAKRISEKTDCPQLGLAILGLIQKEEIPLQCLPWKGGRAIKGERTRLATRRDYGGLADKVPVQDNPRVQINWEGQRHYVPRLVYDLLYQPKAPYRLMNRCGDTTCVNPFHWYPFESQTPEGQSEEDLLEALMSDAYEVSEEDADNAVEQMLTYEIPTCWGDVLASQYVIDIPEGMLIETLRQKNKEHLLP